MVHSSCRSGLVRGGSCDVIAVVESVAFGV